MSTAYAPTSIPTVPCFKGYGGGIQTMNAGASFGGGKIDQGCDAREEARTYMLMDARKAACKVLVYDKKNQRLAKKHPEQAVTMEDCMYKEVVSEPQAVAPAPVSSPVNIYLPANTQAPAVAAVTTPVPVEYKTQMTVTPDQLIGICTFANAILCKPESGPTVITVSSICKQMLEQAKKSLLANPGSVLLITGNRNQSESEIVAVSRANNVKKQLISRGVPPSRIKTEVGMGTSRTVEIVLQTPASVTTGDNK